MNQLALAYPEAAETLEIESGELATSVYGVPVFFRARNAGGADAFHDAATHTVQVSIRYLDTGTDAIVLYYTNDGTTETSLTLLTKNDTGKWKWKHKTVSTAMLFDHSLYLNFDNADFEIYCDSELILSNVTVRDTTLNVEIVWKASAERVTATAGEAAADNTVLSGWTVNESYFVRDTGTAATSAGLAPDDYPFYAGATYANRATAVFRVTTAGALTATSATITGAITATSGAIGGWTIGASTLSSGSISLNSSTPKITLGSATDYLTGAGIFMGLAGGAYKFHIGNPSGNYLSWDGTNLAASGQWITGAGMNPSLQSWKTNITFSSASATQINWSSGTIRLNDGTTYSISSGNTGAMAALTYIYLDTAVSSTVLQTTTTYSTAVGSGKILIASAQNDTVAASVIPFGGQQPLISGAQINALSILAGNIAAGAITATKISVSTLSAISADLGSVTAGTITGATIRTAASNPSVQLDSTELKLKADVYPGSTYLKWKTTGSELIGEILGEYGGSSGYLYAKGYGKDATYPTGLAILGAFKYDTTKYAYLSLSSAGVLTADLREGSNTAASTQALTIQSQTSTTNAAQNGFYVDAYTSGTAAAGFGSQMALRGEDNGGTIRDMANVGALWDVAISGSRRSRLYAAAFNGATANNVLTVPYFARVGSLYRKDTSGGTEVSNTTTETSIYSATIEANELGTDGVMRLNIGGDVQQNSGAAINLTFRVKFGGTTICSLRVSVSNFSGTGGWHLQAMICNAAATNAQRAFGSLVLSKTTSFHDSVADYGTAAIDTTADATLSVTVQWASADSTAKVFSKSTFVELFPS